MPKKNNDVLLGKIQKMIDDKIEKVKAQEVQAEVPEIPPQSETDPEPIDRIKPIEPEQERKIVLSPYSDNGIFREQLLLVLTKIEQSLLRLSQLEK